MASEGSENEDSVHEEDEHEETAPPEFPFDAKKFDLVLDVRAMCYLPYDPDTQGMKSLRAIIFEKGRAVHAPNEPGKIYVCGDWRLMNALVKVHFVSSTHREPELLLAFVDLGFANSAMSGVSVETLALPLLIKKGVYQDAPRMTKIDDVAGFTTIDQGLAPWSITLKPSLMKQDMFKKFNIFTTVGILKWLASQKLEARVLVLAKVAREEIAAAVKATARQDPTQASKTQAIFEAKLASILESIKAFPPSAYDVRMSNRIIKLEEQRDEENDPVWMTTPIQKNLREGTSNFIRTRLNPAIVPIRETVEPVPVRFAAGAEAPPAAGAAGASGGAGLGDLELSEDSELEEQAPPVEKRNRQAPVRLEQELAPAKKAKPAKEPKGKPEVINPATNLPYKRGGPYKKEKPTAAAAIDKAQKAAMKRELKSADTKLEVASLKAQLKAAIEAKKVAEEMLKDKERVLELEIAKAKAEGEREGLKASAEEYKKGIAAGAAIAAGKPFRFANESPMPSSNHSGAGSSTFY